MLREGEVLLHDMRQQDDMLLFLLFFDAQLRPCLHVRTDPQGPALEAGEAGHQLAVCEHLPGIQHPGLQKLRLCLCQQDGTIGKAAAVALRGERHGKFQGSDASLPLRRVQHRHPDRSGDRSPAVPELPAVEKHPARGLNDPCNVRAVVRHDGLRRLLLGQCQLGARLIGVEAGLFQFQFHGSPFLSGRCPPGTARRRQLAAGTEEAAGGASPAPAAATYVHGVSLC